MARSNLNTVETENNETFGTEDAGNWFARGAAQAGLCVRDGKVYGQTDGYMFEVPSPESCDAVAAFLAYSIVKHCEYRIGQNAGGNLNEAVAKFVSELPNFEPARDANAGNAVFMTAVENTVRGLIVDDDGNPAGDDVKVTDTWLLPQRDDNGTTQLRVVPKGTQGAIRMQAAIDSVAKDNAGARDRAIEAAIERGRDKPKAETKGTGRSPGRARASLGITL